MADPLLIGILMEPMDDTVSLFGCSISAITYPNEVGKDMLLAELKLSDLSRLNRREWSSCVRTLEGCECWICWLEILCRESVRRYLPKLRIFEAVPNLSATRGLFHTDTEDGAGAALTFHVLHR
jgi:hypothetical protein